MRRDLLLRHDRTVHAKDGGVPLHSEVKRRPNTRTSNTSAPSKKTRIPLEPATLEHLENNNDLEAAAALITELHHHANAILIQEEESLMEERLAMVSNPELPVFDRAPYPSLAHVPWDMPATPTMEYSDYDVLSRSSSQSSQDGWERSQSNLDLSYPLDRHVRPSHLPQKSISVEAGHNSPHPSYTESFQSSSGLPSASAPLEPPQVDTEQERKFVMDNIKQFDQENALAHCFKLPSRSALNRYLSAYFTLFHHHFPFLHPATFKAHTASPSLLLAVLSIGALYTFEREQS